MGKTYMNKETSQKSLVIIVLLEEWHSTVAVHTEQCGIVCRCDKILKNAAEAVKKMVHTVKLFLNLSGKVHFGFAEKAVVLAQEMA